jgi:hypothetical protein
MLTELFNRRIGTALVIGFVAVGIITGVAAVGASDEPASDTIDDTNTSNMTETEFPWGTVTHETDRETGATHVDVTIETDDGASVSTTAAPDATAEPTDPDAETEQFSWGMVAYTIDSETGVTDVEVIVDADDDVSLAVTTVSEDGSQESTSVVTSAGEAGEDGASISQSTSVSGSSSIVQSNANVSHSTTASVGESIEIDIDGDEDE